MHVFDNSLAAIKDYLGSDARQELLEIFNKHFPAENRTASKKTKFDLFKIDKDKIKQYIDDAASATEAMPVNQALPPSQESLIHWLRVSNLIYDKIKAEAIAFFISSFFVGSIIKLISFSKKEVAEKLGWSAQKLYRYTKRCTRIEQLGAVVGVAGAAALYSVFTATEIDEVAIATWQAFLEKVAIDPEVRFLKNLTNDGFNIKY